MAACVDASESARNGAAATIFKQGLDFGEIDFRGEQSMDRAIAEQLMQRYLALSEPLNAATELTDKIENKEEREQTRRGIGSLMLNVYVDLMRPIIRQYPDLDPDKD